MVTGKALLLVLPYLPTGTGKLVYLSSLFSTRVQESELLFLVFQYRTRILLGVSSRTECSSFPEEAGRIKNKSCLTIRRATLHMYL